MHDTWILRAAAICLALAAPVALSAAPAATEPAAAPKTLAELDEQARAAANKHQAEAARLQLAANAANRQAIEAAEKARAENALAMAAYEAEKAKLASEHAAKLAVWKALVAACEKNRRKVCVKAK